MLRVLLIDDNLDDRMLVIRQLHQSFAELEVTQIIDQASLDRALATVDFDIAITDYQLLWSNGLAVLRQLKAVCPLCPVIMFTNSATQENAIEAMKAGLDDYVVKSPRHYIRLAAAVRLALERAEDRRKANQLEKRLQSLLNRLSVGVFRATIEGQLLEANAAFLNFLGVNSFAEARSLNLKEVFLQPQGRLLFWEQLQQEGQLLGREVQLQRANGDMLWVALNKTITRQGNDLFVEGLIEDITIHKQLKDTLRQKAEELDQANRLKDEFLSTIYHELRSPLNSILGWSQFLTSQSSLDPVVVKRGLNVIERNATAQKNIIEDILDVSNIIQGKLKLQIAPVDLMKAITAAVEVVCPAAEAKSIAIDISFTASAGVVLGDFDRLQQIIWNLLSNAVKFTGNGGRIQIYLKGVNGYAELKVIDTGVGISSDFLPYVFQRFRQADGSTTRRFGGMGLGLAIVRHLVELHGGTVHAESLGEGKGATFTVCIPLAERLLEPDSTRYQSTQLDTVNIAELQYLDSLKTLVEDEPY